MRAGAPARTSEHDRAYYAFLACVTLGLVFFLPALDAAAVESVGRRNVRVAVGMLVVAAYVLLGVRGYFF